MQPCNTIQARMQLKSGTVHGSGAVQHTLHNKRCIHLSTVFIKNSTLDSTKPTNCCFSTIFVSLTSSLTGLDQGVDEDELVALELGSPTGVEGLTEVQLTYKEKVKEKLLKVCAIC